MIKEVRQQVGDPEDHDRIFGRGIAAIIFLVLAAGAVNACFWRSNSMAAVAHTAINPDPVQGSGVEVTRE